MRSEKKDAFSYIPRDFSEVRKYIDAVNEKYGIEISIVDDIEVYVILQEMKEIAEQYGYENALKEIDDLIKQNFARDLAKHNFIMLSRKLHESIVRDKSSFVDIIENDEL